VAALLRVHRVARRDERGPRADHDARAQPDAGVVEERAALVDEDPFRQLQPQTVVGVEGRVDRHPGRERTPEDLLEERCSARLVLEREDVEA